jgi:hypothetical protein
MCCYNGPFKFEIVFPGIWIVSCSILGRPKNLIRPKQARKKSNVGCEKERAILKIVGQNVMGWSSQKISPNQLG